MSNFDMCRTINIRYCTRNAKYLIVDTCRQFEFFCRSNGDLDRLIAYESKFLDINIRHFFVRIHRCSYKSIFLYASCFLDRFTQCLTCYGRLCFAKFANFYSWNLDKNINTIKYWSGKPRPISVDRQWRTNTWFLTISKKSTRTRIHCSDK